VVLFVNFLKGIFKMKDLKKILFLFTLIAMFIISGLKSYACTDMLDTLTINGCEYQLLLCVDCQSYGPALFSVSVKSFMKLDSECVQTLNPEDVLHQIESQIKLYEYLHGHLCDPNNYLPPPCPNYPPDPMDIVTINHYFCYRQTWVVYGGQMHENWEACDYDNYCSERIYYCWSPDPPPLGTKEIRPLGTSWYGTPQCTLEGWDAETGECYLNHTLCNP
jgi:hypothetical protein